MESLVVSLDNMGVLDESLVGGKVLKLAKLKKEGYRIPPGFCLTTQAYKLFIKENRLDEIIQFELGRKDFSNMRWEEIWDASLRIRTEFQQYEISEIIEAQLREELSEFSMSTIFAVRSSSPLEDSVNLSFAGLHESITDVVGLQGILNAIKIVWSSLWSNAALLYQKELKLNPLNSSMAILIQPLIREEVSGVAFGMDPRTQKKENAIIEAVPGLCQDLVDGKMDPDRWIISKSELKIITETKGETEKGLLTHKEVENVAQNLLELEKFFNFYPDIEWTGKGDNFTILQARPITKMVKNEKSYYLTLTPNDQKLRALAKEVSENLIPEIEKEGNKYASKDLEGLDDQSLSEEIKKRYSSLQKWEEVYKSYFIPFAHGIRRFGVYYNDAVKPDDPFEFLELYKNQPMISTERNKYVLDLAEMVRKSPRLKKALGDFIKKNSSLWIDLEILIEPEDAPFYNELKALTENFMNYSLDNEIVSNNLNGIVSIIYELSEKRFNPSLGQGLDIDHLEVQLYFAVGEDRKQEAQELLEIGRLSWKLRDDDNLLLGRIEAELIRALNIAIKRMFKKEQIEIKPDVDPSMAEMIADSLVSGKKIKFEERTGISKKEAGPKIKPRQLVGQPASPGIYSGKARCFRGINDFHNFKSGEVLVCDSIQPNMTHLVLLAGAIVERRGGMLIHGSIIAREMGIPCVNGIPNAIEQINDGDLITVDGDLGIVTLGKPELDFEK
jgi:pyruvate,water dikinase